VSLVYREKDCAIVHGTSTFLKERLFDMSDPYQINICPKCGTMVNALNQCMVCEHDKTTQVYIPYACKLLFQELQAMGVKINIKPTE
jgi:DNA-directed RNA polymerase II subunit RPB2